MMRPAQPAAAAGALVALALLTACGSATREAPPSDNRAEPTLVRGGAPGAAGSSPADEADSYAVRHAESDVHFVRDMIAHHAQALDMTALVPERTRRDEMRRLARRIEVSQKDEIARMRRWLEDRGEPLSSPDASHAHAGKVGMLTPDQMVRLARSEGEDFDRLFLEYMILHHEGALAMVGELFATPGAAQETEIYMLASHIDADQRAEIARMRRMLDARS